MGEVQDIGPEITAQDVGVGLGGVLIGGTERVPPDAVLAAVTAGIGITDEFDDAVLQSLGLKKCAIRQEGAERRPALLGLRPLLDDHPVRLGLALLLLEKDDGRVPVDDKDLVRLRGRLPVDPDVEIILPGISGLQGQIAAREGDAGLDGAPVERDGTFRNKGSSDIGDAAVGGRNTLASHGRSGRGCEKQGNDYLFHTPKDRHFFRSPQGMPEERGIIGCSYSPAGAFRLFRLLVRYMMPTSRAKSRRVPEMSA